MNFKPKMYTVLFYIVIFYAAVAQGGYFTFSLIILNLFFLFMLIRQKEIVFDVFAMAFLSIFLVMILSTVLLSHSIYAAMVELLKYLLAFTSYLFFANAKDTGRFEKAFFHSFILIMAFGLLGMVGLSPISGMVTEIGGRLQSFLQYANTTALLLGVGAFYSTHFFLRDKKKRYVALAVLFFVALIFTNSRIGFAVFALTYIAYCFRFVSWKLKGGLLLAIVALGVFLIATDSRLARISIFEPTLVERYISYFDAVKMLSFRPLGIGVGNWQFESFYHQSAPYQVRYIHNAYLQTALDGGIIPLAFWLAVIIVCAVKMKRNTVHLYIGFFIASTAFWEIHFNFGLVIIYFSFLLATTGGEALKKFEIRKYVKAIPVLLIVMLSAFLLSEYAIQRGEDFEQRGNHQEAMTAFRRAHSLNPFNDTLYFRYARLERNMARAINYLERAYEINPWNISVITALSEGHSFAGDFEQSLYFANRLFTIFPYSTVNQEFLRAAVDRGYSEGLIDDKRHEALHEEINIRIDIKNAAINPLFRFINENMEY